MRFNAFRLKAAANAALCAAALSLAALGGGCARGGPAASTESAGVARKPEALPAQATSPTPAQETAIVESPLPPPDGYVSDFAEVIDAETEELLEAKLRQLKERANIEMAVATVETTGGRDIFDYSLAVARGWGVGPPEGQAGGGLLLLLAIKERKWRLQVSDRLLADLPNDETAEMAKVMSPSLRAGRYGEAVTKYADALIRRLAERRGFPAQGGATETPAAPQKRSKTTPPAKP